MRKRKMMLILLLPLFIVFITGFKAFPDIQTVKASGTLTSIEEDGSIIIDRKGYLADPSVVVINKKGEQIKLKKLSLPVKVDFEYAYTQHGFLITYIEERKKTGGLQ